MPPQAPAPLYVGGGGGLELVQLIAQQRRGLELEVGRGLAHLPLQPLDQKVYSQIVASHKGSILLVNFWATWCVPCREEMPQLVQLANRYNAKGLKLVTVSCDEPEDEGKAAEFLAQKSVRGPAYLKRVADDEAFINFVDRKWSGALPALYLYDRSGRLARSFIGETDMSVLEEAILKLP